MGESTLLRVNCLRCGWAGKPSDTDAMQNCPACTQLDASFVRDVLLFIWDPCGVAGEPACIDEYDAYAGAVWQVAVLPGMTEENLCRYLDELSEKKMSVRGDAKRAAKVLLRRFRT